MSTPMMDQGGQPVNIIGNTQANSNQPITQDASVILVETILSILAFYLAFKTLSSYTTNAIFMQKWQISKPVALDTANKTISAIFATLSSLTGIYVLMTYNGVYYLDCAITYFMPFAMGYFLYDFFAMAEVYMARLDEKYQNTNQVCIISADRLFKANFGNLKAILKLSMYLGRTLYPCILGET